MNTNFYSPQLNEKTDVELQQMLAKEEAYVPEAIQAVKWELERRQVTLQKENTEQPIQEEDHQDRVQSKIELGLEDVLDAEEVMNEDDNSPRIYSKTVIFAFSAVFNTLYGSVLLMSNFRALGKSDKNAGLLTFGILFTVFQIGMTTFFIQSFFGGLALNFVGIGVLIGYFWNQNIDREIPYRNKSIVKPLVISILLSVIFVLGFMYLAKRVMT